MKLDVNDVDQTVSTGSLPGWERVERLVAEAYERNRDVDGGSVADYIPVLARADRDLFGVIELNDGHPRNPMVNAGAPATTALVPGATPDVYTRQCSLAVTARDLAVMGATPTDGGVNPVTGERVVASVCRGQVRRLRRDRDDRARQGRDRDVLAAAGLRPTHITPTKGAQLDASHRHPIAVGDRAAAGRARSRLRLDLCPDEPAHA